MILKHFNASLTISLCFLLSTVSASLVAQDSTTKESTSEATLQVESVDIEKLQLIDTDKKTHQPFSAKSSRKAIVLVFISTDCPIANAFQPSLAELSNEFDEKGVKFFFVHCCSITKPDEIKKHIADFEIKVPAIHDNEQTLGKLVGATVTPEAIVIDDSGKVRYRGMINNLYEGYGKKRRHPTEHYLKDALNSLVSNKPIAITKTKPLGCHIFYAK